MTTLKIRLDIRDLRTESNDFDVAASITPIPSRDRRVSLSRDERNRLQNIVIKAGDMYSGSPEFTYLTLEPGTYFVEAILPSEDVVGEEVQILEEPEEQEIRLKLQNSPHEWLGWQRLNGNVTTSQHYGSQREFFQKSTPISLEAELISILSPAADEQPDMGSPNAGLSQGYFFRNDPLREFLRTHAIADFPGWARLVPAAQVSPPLKSFESDGLYENHNFNWETLNRLTGAPRAGGDYHQKRFDRFYLFGHGQGFPDQYCVVPVPWGKAFGGGDAIVQASLLMAGTATQGADGSDQGFRLSTIVQEPAFGSLIGYLGAGKMAAADTIVKRARGFLFEKGENPFAAAAGAYVLMTHPISERPEYWHDWVRNLMNRFPWLPDGAILYGKLLMEQNRDRATLDIARASLLEGYRRGLPFFSKGVSYLLEGLNRFVNDDRRERRQDASLEIAQTVVRDLALRTNIRQPFTSVLLD